MTKKDELKPEKFHAITGGSDLSAGVCGPDGCVLDWNKVNKKAEGKRDN